MIGEVRVQGVLDDRLGPTADRAVFTNKTDWFYTTKLVDGGTFVLHRFAPAAPLVTTNPYPVITLPGTKLQYVRPVSTSPFYKDEQVSPPAFFPTPYKPFTAPGILPTAGIGIFKVP